MARRARSTHKRPARPGGATRERRREPDERRQTPGNPLRRDPRQAENRSKIRVARIGAAHGVRGEVKLWPFTEDPLAVADYGPLETEDGARHFEIESLRPTKDFLVARIAGIDDRNAAEMLRNIDLFVPRDRLPPIEEEDTYYHADLVGLSAVTEDGAEVGKVLALHNFGAGDLVEIAPAGGGQTLMLPFTEAAVPEVDLKARRIVVTLPTQEEAVVPGDRASARETRDP